MLNSKCTGSVNSIRALICLATLLVTFVSGLTVEADRGALIRSVSRVSSERRVFLGESEVGSGCFSDTTDVFERPKSLCNPRVICLALAALDRTSISVGPSVFFSVFAIRAWRGLRFLTPSLIRSWTWLVCSPLGSCPKVTLQQRAMKRSKNRIGLGFMHRILSPIY